MIARTVPRSHLDGKDGSTMKAWMISAGMALVTAFPALAWELKPSDGIVWTPPGGQVAESNSLAATAAFLGDTVSRMAGRTVSVIRADAPAAGIHLVVNAPAGTPSADLVFSGRLEAYVIEATGATLRISGPTSAAVQNGVMGFLHRQGCRWLVPSPKWWIIPKGGRIVFEGREEGAPSFANRRIWYAYGTGDDTLTGYYKTWSDANRLGGAALFQTGHSYGNIVDRNKAAFAAHPEYYALRQAPSNAPAVDPVEDALAEKKEAGPVPAAAMLVNRDTLKFCLSNPGLRALCLADRIALLKTQRAANPLAFMVSMDPSDGPGTCACAECKKLGSTTDRVVSLANFVAAGLREAVPGGWVGMYAYALHREPPTIAMESNIHVQVAMAFNRTAYSYDDLIRLWGEKAGSLGIREYYGVEAWDFGLPGRIRGANPDYHQKRIPQYRAARAVSVNAESNDNWGGQGPGFYVAARLLWNADDDVAAARADFLRAAFGPAAAPMGELYAAFASDTNVSPDRQARLYDLAYKGLEAAAEPEVRARVVDVIAYLNYVHLFARFEPIEPHTEPYYAALETLMNYAHRIQPRSMVAAYALARRLCNGNVKGKKDSFWMFGEKPVWKHGAPYTDEEILALAAGIRAALKSLPK
jgi:hypothetical protein